MKIIKAEFVTSADCLKNAPALNMPEIALIGRSNVGKSSFINAVTNRKKLAKTSNTPGKTRLINFFNINDKFSLVDLPGYGYAKVSQKEQQRWQRDLEEYLLQREELVAVIQFIDARHEVQKNDLQMREWLEFNNFNIITVATKADVLSKNAVPKSVKDISKTINSKVYAFSAKEGLGKHEVLDKIEEFIN